MSGATDPSVAVPDQHPTDALRDNPRACRPLLAALVELAEAEGVAVPWKRRLRSVPAARTEPVTAPGALSPADGGVP